MSSIARVTDTSVGVCYGHESPREFTATFISGSPDVTSDGLSVVRLGDTGTTNCGHIVTVISASSTVMSNGIPVARVGDTVVSSGGGTGTIISGSSNNSAG